jgi:ubiquinone/menaquinone biosynthesis C-methylase UbiE
MKLNSPLITKTIKFILDEFVPPVIRDQRWFYYPIVKLWNGKMDLDFKVKAFQMSESEFTAAYENLVPMRQTDNTPSTVKFVLNQVIGKRVLEVGCGNGDVSLMCAANGFDVTATDLAIGNLKELEKRNVTIERNGNTLKTQVANVEHLPFANGSFDTTICLHTLEHVRDLAKAVSELKRVTSNRIIIIVPKQRYFRFTPDYHLNFFGSKEQLMLTMGIKNSTCIERDYCLCFSGDLTQSDGKFKGYQANQG